MPGKNSRNVRGPLSCVKPTVLRLQFWIIPDIVDIPEFKYPRIFQILRDRKADSRTGML